MSTVAARAQLATIIEGPPKPILSQIPNFHLAFSGLFDFAHPRGDSEISIYFFVMEKREPTQKILTFLSFFLREDKERISKFSDKHTRHAPEDFYQVLNKIRHEKKKNNIYESVQSELEGVAE